MVRKYQSGYEKRKKAKRVEQLIQSQKGALDRFILKEPQVEENSDNSKEVNEANVDDGNIEHNDVNMDNANIPSDFEQNVEHNCENIDHTVEQNETVFDIYDLRRWDSLDSKLIDILALNGPKRDLSIVKGPKDKLSRRFSSTFYTRYLPNGEPCDREWLVYSKELDKVFCFCCKIFKKGHKKGNLVKGLTIGCILVLD